MKKILINIQHGGFSFSNEAIKRYAELTNRECHIFSVDYNNDFRYVESKERSILDAAFDIPNPNEIIKSSKEIGIEEHNKLYSKHKIDLEGLSREDLILIQIVEELGEKANGRFSELKIVEIPDDVKYTIEEYDGWEHIAEEHRTWKGF